MRKDNRVRCVICYGPPLPGRYQCGPCAAIVRRIYAAHGASRGGRYQGDHRPSDYPGKAEALAEFARRAESRLPLFAGTRGRDRADEN